MVKTNFEELNQARLCKIHKLKIDNKMGKKKPNKKPQATASSNVGEPKPAPEEEKKQVVKEASDKQEPKKVEQKALPARSAQNDEDDLDDFYSIAAEFKEKNKEEKQSAPPKDDDDLDDFMDLASAFKAKAEEPEKEVKPEHKVVS